jgi:TrkA domain protein
MQIRMADLPGIGKKLSFITAQDNMIVLIIHHSGKRELYFFEDSEADEADFSINLTADETREMGAQLLGATYQPIDIDTMKTFKKQLVMEWVELQPESPITGKTIGEAQIRTRTGASIVAIVRGEDVIVSPGIDEILKPGDTLMGAGKSEQMGQFESLCRGEEV